MVSSKIVRFHGAGIPLERTTVTTGPPAAGEILARTIGCTLCGSDLHTIHGRRQVPTPTILGHEIVGEIVSIGAGPAPVDLNGSPLSPGDRVVWSIVANCGDCFYCLRDLPQKCLRSIKYGHEPDVAGKELLGGFAEHCRLVPGAAVVRISRGLPLEVACPTSCGTATIAAAMAAAEEVADRVVLVSGCGLLGLTACAMAASRGAAQVIGVDVSPERLAMARQFGATHVCGPKEAESLVCSTTNGFGVDAVIECSGATPAVEAMLPLLRLGGRLVLVGSVFPSEGIPISPERIVRRNLTLVGVHNYRPADLLTAVQFLEKSGETYPFASLVSAWYPLDQIDAAVDHGGRAIRIGIRF
jgi:putative phosphonate catabolism associated alcohol dehydrogenase